MEVNKKISDCYFYYYSTCTKVGFGDTCQFRHEPLALGCETMCYHWQQGNCVDQQCKFRHMELRKNRKQIPCYWETQPGGCLKKHCPFQHKSAPGGSSIQEPTSTQIGPPMPSINQEQGNIITMHNMAAATMAHPAFQQPSRRHVVMDPSKMVGVAPAVLTAPHNRRSVDPLLVNLEEESDSESMPSLTPVKESFRIKSVEQLRLEKIQEESAAFYSYDSIEISTYQPSNSADDKSDRKLSKRHVAMSLDEIENEFRQAPKRTISKSDNFKILTLDEIRATKRRKLDFNIDIKVESTPKIDYRMLTKTKLSSEKLDQDNSIDTTTSSDSNDYIMDEYTVILSDIQKSRCDIIKDSNTIKQSLLLDSNVPDVVSSCTGAGNPSLDDLFEDDILKI